MNEVLGYRRDDESPDCLRLERERALDADRKRTLQKVQCGEWCGIVAVRLRQHALARLAQHHLAAGRRLQNSAGEAHLRSARVRFPALQHARDLACTTAQNRGVHPLIDQANALRFARINRTACEDDVECCTHADQARQTCGSAKTGDDAELNFGQSDARLFAVGCNAVGARQDELGAAAQADSINCGYGGNRQSSQMREHLLARACFCGSFPWVGDRADLVYVGTRDEGAIFPAPDHHRSNAAGRRVICHLTYDLVEPLHHCAAQDIHARTSAVECEPRHCLLIDR